MEPTRIPSSRGAPSDVAISVTVRFVSFEQTRSKLRLPRFLRNLAITPWRAMEM
ncbi:MAG: hypothetical protein ACLFQV_08240 [Vulcanimicrobiota bacterium]